MTNQQKKPTVTAVLHKDTGVVTAFFNDLPGLIVQGSDQTDVTKKLSSLLDSYIKRLDAMKNNIDIQVKSLC